MSAFVLDVPPNAISSDERPLEILLDTDTVKLLTPGSRPSDSTYDKVDLSGVEMIRSLYIFICIKTF